MEQRGAASWKASPEKYRPVLAIVSLGLSALAAVALVAAHLALTDIWHGEADAALEWNVLRVAGVVIAASQLVAIGCAFRGLRARRA